MFVEDIFGRWHGAKAKTKLTLCNIPFAGKRVNALPEGQFLCSVCCAEADKLCGKHLGMRRLRVMRISAQKEVKPLKGQLRLF